ncbi:MAG: hypothetical protein IJN44_07245 [Clostridia bacterium]|nr:hypothetical protein [Clostridia bacterium]
MEDKKICPLLMAARFSDMSYCGKEKCAWFVPFECTDGKWEGCCAVSLAATSLRNIDHIADEAGVDLYKLRIGDDSQ